MWVTLLLEKYLYQRPINRLLESFKDIEFDASAGTIGDGLKKLAPLFEPVLREIIKKNQTERHLHADETRWLVFEFIDGKKSYRWATNRCSVPNCVTSFIVVLVSWQL